MPAHIQIQSWYRGITHWAKKKKYEKLRQLSCNYIIRVNQSSHQ